MSLLWKIRKVKYRNGIWLFKLIHVPCSKRGGVIEGRRRLLWSVFDYDFLGINKCLVCKDVLPNDIDELFRVRNKERVIIAISIVLLVLILYYWLAS